MEKPHDAVAGGVGALERMPVLVDPEANTGIVISIRRILRMINDDVSQAVACHVMDEPFSDDVIASQIEVVDGPRDMGRVSGERIRTPEKC